MGVNMIFTSGYAVASATGYWSSNSPVDGTTPYSGSWTVIWPDEPEGISIAYLSSGLKEIYVFGNLEGAQSGRVLPMSGSVTGAVRLYSSTGFYTTRDVYNAFKKTVGSRASGTATYPAGYFDPAIWNLGSAGFVSCPYLALTASGLNYGTPFPAGSVNCTKLQPPNAPTCNFDGTTNIAFGNLQMSVVKSNALNKQTTWVVNCSGAVDINFRDSSAGIVELGPTKGLSAFMFLSGTSLMGVVPAKMKAGNTTITIGATLSASGSLDIGQFSGSDVIYLDYQ